MTAFDNPLLLYAAPLIALFVSALAFWARRTRITRASQWSAKLGTEAASHGRRGILLLGLASLAIVVALAGPRWGSRVVETETKGLDLIIAIDISRSMLAEDTEPSRLERAKREARRLIHDLSGDRIGLVAFAGQSYVMSPLTVDGSALHLLVDALDPDVASTGGSDLALALGQGRDLLLAGNDVADRVLVVFSDGEAHDSMPAIMDRAERLRRDGIHLILVAEGGRNGVRIPVRDFDGELVGHQLDPGGEYVETRRRDDILTAVADAAQGVLVSAEVGDQAGRVRELVAAFKRTPLATTTAAQDISRAWVPILVAVILLLLHTATRKTSALAGVVLTMVLGDGAFAQNPSNAADEAWLAGRFERATALYRLQALEGRGGDTTWFNVGTAALATGDTALARAALEISARSIEPGIRFGSRYNLGLLELRLAVADSAQLVSHLEAARSHYREALLLRPTDAASKWNLELANRMVPPPDDGSSENPQNAGAGQEDSPQAEAQGLSIGQAEQILNSIAEEERRTLLRRNRKNSQVREARGRRDW
jgi:Ca-activated chloride channel family protein